MQSIRWITKSIKYPKPKIEKKAETTNTEAYEYYLKGKYIFEQRENKKDREVAYISVKTISPQNWGLFYLEKRSHTIVTQSCKYLVLRTFCRLHNRNV